MKFIKDIDKSWITIGLYSIHDVIHGCIEDSTWAGYLCLIREKLYLDVGMEKIAGVAKCIQYHFPY